MNITDKQWEWVRWFVIITLVAVFGFFNLNAPIQVPPTPAPDSIGAMGTGIQPAQVFRSVRATNSMQNDGTLTQVGVSTFTGAATLATANVSTLNVGGYTQSGAVRFGSASTVISGTTIAHGFGITPTTFLIQPAYIPAATFTQTLFAHSCGAISCTVGISTGSVVTFTTVNWLGGK